MSTAAHWDPMDALQGLQEPLSEGVRMLLLDEVQQILDRLRNMTKWLHALDPALNRPARAATPQRTAAKDPRPSHRRRKGGDV
jgi:hypothetical protein